jgi:hypothetical protein
MDGNTVAPDATNAGKMGRSIVLWPLKVGVLWLALLIGTVVAGKLVPIDLPPTLADGPLSTVQALLVVTGLTAIALGLVAEYARQRSWRLGLLIFIASFAIGSAMMQLETLWFNDSLRLPLMVVGKLVASSAITFLVVALAAALVFRPVEVPALPVPAKLWWRIAMMAVIYVVLYFAAGALIAWQSAAVRDYYGNGLHIAFLPLVAFQIFRGTLWGLIALFIVSRLHAALLTRALIMGVLFSVMTAAQLLYPTPFFPWSVRSAHLLEVGTSEFLYGLIATFVLLADAKKQSA